MRGRGRFSGVVALAVGLSLLCASVAQAAIEQLPGSEGVFGELGEQAQLGGAGGMAINYSGAGGVPRGTIYVATQGPAGGVLRIAQYRPQPAGKSGFDFALSWEVRGVEGPYERCGPKSGEPGNEHCASQPNSIPGQIGVAVDQGSGNVFVFSASGMSAGGLTVREYDANGEALIARFAELAPSSVTTPATPSQVHGSPYPSGIAVNDAAEVFVFDWNTFDEAHRLMRFKPKTPGNLTEYEYVSGGDIGAAGAIFPTHPVIDAAGDIYVAGENTIEKYDPDKPGDPPICKFQYPPGGITGMAVEPDTGAPFFFAYKPPKRIHQLSPCDGSGKFAEQATITLQPERDDPFALGFDPERNVSASRPLGALYAIAPNGVPSSGVGKGEPGKPALGYIFAGAQEGVPPQVESVSVLRATATTVELQAEINPKGFQSSFVFQYMTDAAYEEAGEEFTQPEEAPLGGGGIVGGGQKPLAATAALSGLFPGTEYHFRVIARSSCKPSEVCEVIGSPAIFRTFPIEAQVLPDGRAYELVSPPAKNSGQVLPADPNTKSCGGIECKPGAAYQHFPMQSAPDGNAVVYEGNPFVLGEGAVIENEYLARRGAAGWTSSNLTPPQLLSKGRQGYKVFDPSLTEALIEQTNPSLSPEAPAEFTNLYRQPAAGPTNLSPLLTNGDAFIHRVPLNGAGSLRLAYAGGSTDLSRLFFSANDALTSEPGEAGEKTNLYESRGGSLQQVNLAPGSGAPLPGAVFGSGTLLESGGSNIKVAVVTHAISDDGSRAFWTGEDGKAYVRVGGTETLEVPGPGGCKASVALALRACFLTASADGSRVLLSNGQIYELNEEAGAYEASTDLTAGKGGFEGIAGQSADLSHLYFVDSQVLTGEEANDQGAKAQAGQHNLYAWVEGTTSFVATLLNADDESPGTWQAAAAVRTAEASPAGRYLAFTSIAPLIEGFDNIGSCKIKSGTDEYEAGPCREVLLYDSVTGSLSCPSCSPANATSTGQSTLRVILNVLDSLPQPRYLTDSGRLYFDSQNPLVAADTNGDTEDVYQYEPEGLGGCAREGGCVSLISAGRGPSDSNFLAIDSSGDNVFFTSRDRLVPADGDELIDLYDARVKGGFPSVVVPPPGEQPSSPPPIEPTPSSSSFVGSGNPPAKGCKKGRVKRKGKCVKKNGHHKKKKSRTKRQSSREVAK